MSRHKTTPLFTKKEIKTTKLDALIQEMTARAQAAAETAWTECLKKGYVGDYQLPAPSPFTLTGGTGNTETDKLLRFIRRWFLTGYSLALLDHTMEAVRRMKGAADLDQSAHLQSLTPN